MAKVDLNPLHQHLLHLMGLEGSIYTLDDMSRPLDELDSS